MLLSDALLLNFQFGAFSALAGKIKRSSTQVSSLGVAKRISVIQASTDGKGRIVDALHRRSLSFLR